jgi:hypothetical protein
LRKKTMFKGWQRPRNAGGRPELVALGFQGSLSS